MEKKDKIPIYCNVTIASIFPIVEDKPRDIIVLREGHSRTLLTTG